MYESPYYMTVYRQNELVNCYDQCDCCIKSILVNYSKNVFCMLYFFVLSVSLCVCLHVCVCVYMCVFTYMHVCGCPTPVPRPGPPPLLLQPTASAPQTAHGFREVLPAAVHSMELNSVTAAVPPTTARLPPPPSPMTRPLSRRLAVAHPPASSARSPPSLSEGQW